MRIELEVLYSVYLPQRRGGGRWVYHQCSGWTVTQLGTSQYVEPGDDATAMARGRLERAKGATV